MHISLLMMLKNEEKRLGITLDSVKGYVDSIIVYDTGSTDSTIKILETFSKTNNIPLYLKHGEFQDFSTSRNVSLDFADEHMDVDFLLLMDCNDELRGGKQLRNFCTSQLKTNETSWLVNQEWFCGGFNKYYNVRLIKPRHTWRYQGVVHEWIQKQNQKDVYTTHKIPDVCLYQDRTKDDDKTGKRFSRDYELLLAEYIKDSNDPRTVFYLAQTCSCLGKNTEAYKYYDIRSKMPGFQEENFHCYLRMGEIAKQCAGINEKYPDNKISLPDDTDEATLLRSFTWDIALAQYMKAFEHTPRAEPAVAIAEYYRSKDKLLLSYHFARMACELPIPTEAILFVDNYIYDYTRFHIMGIVAFYNGKHQEGLEACKIAIQTGNRKQIDLDNIKFYKDTLASVGDKIENLRLQKRQKRR